MIAEVKLLILAAAAPIVSLYQGKKLDFEFRRTVQSPDGNANRRLPAHCAYPLSRAAAPGKTVPMLTIFRYDR